MSATLRGTGVPRLQELSFLSAAMLTVVAGGGFEDVRQSLIAHMSTLREAETLTGNTAPFRLAKYNPTRYVENTTAALGELMKLGFLEKSPLPSSGSAAVAYQDRTFDPTEAGEEWAALLAGKARGTGPSFDVLLRELWRIHPQFSGYLRLLAIQPFVLPTARWSEANPADAGIEPGLARRRHVEFLSDRAFRAVEAGVTGWSAERDDIAGAIKSYIEDRYAAAASRNVGNPYARNRDFVGACEEALVSFAFQQAGLKMDYITLEILRRWTRVLNVANFSYHVPGAPALRLWSTAELDVDDSNQLLRVHRHGLSTHGDAVIDAIPEAFDQARRQDPTSSWVPIYRVRAAVALKLQLNDNVVDAALREFNAGIRRPDASFTINFDSAEIGTTPPTESPLRVTDPRTNRTITYRVMALIRQTERTSS